MNKLKLHLEDLQVDTFQTTAPEKPRGTVFGEQCTCHTQCTCPGCPTCAGYGTCDASCNGTCAGSCNGSCGASCDYTCGATCDYSCGETCGGYTCPTSPDPRMECVICAG